jgi:hypothetical protein
MKETREEFNKRKISRITELHSSAIDIMFKTRSVDSLLALSLYARIIAIMAEASRVAGVAYNGNISTGETYIICQREQLKEGNIRRVQESKL